jgi:hypothetical protein
MTVRVVQDTKGAGIEGLLKRLRARAIHRVLIGVPSGAGRAGRSQSSAFIAATRIRDVELARRAPFLSGGIRKAFPRVSRLAAGDLSHVARGQMTMHAALERTGVRRGARSRSTWPARTSCPIRPRRSRARARRSRRSTPDRCGRT